MSKGFEQVGDLAADDEIQTRSIMEWITCQCKDLMTTKSGGGSTSISRHTTQVSSDCVDFTKSASGSVLDPNITRRKGAPKKLRRKSPLERTSTKAKAKSGGTASTNMPETNSNENIVHDGMNLQLSQQYSMSTPMLYLPNAMVTPLSLSQLSMPTPLSLSQHVPYANVVNPNAGNITFNAQGEPLSNYYQNLLNQGDSDL